MILGREDLIKEHYMRDFLVFVPKQKTLKHWHMKGWCFKFLSFKSHLPALEDKGRLGVNIVENTVFVRVPTSMFFSCSIERGEVP